MRINNKDSIGRLASEVIDTGRRGDPKPGCDCMQCFGYCMVDREQAERDQALRNDGAYNPLHARNVPLEFSE